MRLRVPVLGSCIYVVMAVCASPASAATAKECTHECVPGKPTVASYTWDFKGEANSIFKEVQADAQQALFDADRLQSFTENPNLSWEAHAGQLQDLKTDINSLGTKLCRLETIRRVLAPWQQREIVRIATTVRLMADNAEDAILFVNDKPNDLWLATYRTYLNNLYSEANNLTRSAGDAVAFATASKEYRDLGHKLGVRTSS